MNVHRKGLAALTLGLVCGLATSGLALEKTFITPGAALSTDSAWDPSGAPTAGDTGIIGGGETAINAVFTANLAGPPDALVVKSNGSISLNATMNAEHNIILEGGLLRSGSGNYAYGSTITLSNDCRFMSFGPYLTFTGLVQDAGAVAGRLIITNSTTNLAGSITMRRVGNTYSGGTVLAPGSLTISSTDVLGTGPVELNPGAVLFYNANISLASRIIAQGGKIQVGAGYTLRCTNSVRGTLEMQTITSASASLGGLIEDYSAS